MEPDVTAGEAEARGFTVDRHCYPWFAYKGPRFDPTTSMPVVTPRYPEMVDARALAEDDPAAIVRRAAEMLRDEWEETGGLIGEGAEIIPKLEALANMLALRRRRGGRVGTDPVLDAIAAANRSSSGE